MLFLDTSALIKRYVAEDGSDVVVELMERDPEWAASALARLETQVTLCHLGFTETDELVLLERVRTDWDRFLVVPLTPPTLDRAIEIGCALRVRTLDAIHISSAAQLPIPLTLVTFDAVQAAAAQAYGLEVAPR